MTGGYEPPTAEG